MCLSSPSPQAQPAATVVAPIAPLEPPKPMAMADASSSGAAASRRGGVSQLRIQSQAAKAAAPLGSGMAAEAASTISGRKAQLDAQLAAAGG